MNRKDRRNIVKKIQSMDSTTQKACIQAFEVEGYTFPVAMSSLLDGTPISTVDGCSNDYTTYSTQVQQTIKKYNGMSDNGNTLVRTCVDMRTSFIGGEGLSVAGEKLTENHKTFIKEFLARNGLNSTRLFNLVKRLEIHGKALTCIMKGSEREEYIPLFGVYASNKIKIQPLNKFFPQDKQRYLESSDSGEVTEIKGLKSPTLIVTGGDGEDLNNTTTKIGLALTECDNYDRALKTIRELNYTNARITPTFKVKSASEAVQLKDWLAKSKWKKGEPFIGSADFSFQSPSTATLDNLKTELTSNLKSIAGLTTCPVHWLGYVDLMSNRATAVELYQNIYNGTVLERTAISQAFKKIIIDAQRTYIDAGGDLINKVIEDIEVTLPLIDLGRFKEMVDSYSKLWMDGAINMDTYRNNIPNIDPLLEQKLDEEKLKDDIAKLENNENGFNIPEEKQVENKEKESE